MSVLEKLKQKETWDDFLASVEENTIYVDKRLVKKIKKIMDKGIENITLNFPTPVKKEIAKYKNSKKRTIYSFGDPYNIYLKCINFILQTDDHYSNKFCLNSIAYQKGKSIKRYVDSLRNEMIKGRRTNYIKTDFTNYFNSIDLDVLIKKMSSFFLFDDADLYDLLVGILSNENVIHNNNKVIIKQKGVMAGLPISGYLANLYMNDVDWAMYYNHIYYTRYADDVIILTNAVEKDKATFNKLLEPLNVVLNPTKVEEGKVKDGITFLGFRIHGHTIDINERSLRKMKKRIKRRSKWFSKWSFIKHVSRETTARTFIKGMNRKFYSRVNEDGTCWLEWYAKSITTHKTLKEIDAYMCQYIRYILSGKHKGYKKNAEIPYSKLKELGFKPLVNEFWKVRKSITVSVKK